MDINAFGHSGPWAKRPGFDQVAQAAIGFAAKEGEPEKPRFSPVFYVGDLMVYFAAAGMMGALLRRSIEGGSYHVKISLARARCGYRSWAFLILPHRHLYRRMIPIRLKWHQLIQFMVNYLFLPHLLFLAIWFYQMMRVLCLMGLMSRNGGIR